MSNNWSKTILGDLIDIRHGFAFPGKGITNIENRNLLITPGNFEIGGGFRSSKNKYFSGEVDENFLLSNGEIIISMTDLSKEGDTLGYSAKIPTNSYHRYLHNQRIGKVIALNNDFHLDFIYWLMRSKNYRHWILSSATGSTVKHTSPKRIRSYEFLLPPIDEQKVIAYILGTIEEKIELNKKTNETLEGIVKALFKSWFIDFDPVKAKFEGCSTELSDEISDLFPDLFEDSEIGEIPSSWDTKKISDFGQTICGKTPSTKNANYYGNDFMFITIPDLHKGLHVTSSSKGLSKSGAELQSNKLLSKGSVLVSCIATPGLIGVTYESCFTNQQINAITPHDKNYTWFIAFYLLINKDLLLSFGGGGSVFFNLNKSKFDSIEILAPPERIIEKFNNFASPLMDKCFDLKKEISLLSNIRNKLLPKLISGELRIPDAEKIIEEVSI